MAKDPIVNDTNAESKELSTLKTSLGYTRDFLILVKKLDALPEMKRAPYDTARSLYQAVSKDLHSQFLERKLKSFFGEPKKRAGQPMPLKMRFNSSVKYLKGIRDEQAFYMKKTKSGFFYGALWPWHRAPETITVHLGYCSNKMTDKDVENLEKLVKSRVLNEGVFSEFEEDKGGRVHGISLASFLHMAVLEKITCSIEIKTENIIGKLYLSKGELVDAKTGTLKGKPAAYEIISWEDTEIDIRNAGGKKENTINEPLMEVLIEALRLRKNKRDRKIGPSEQARRESYEDRPAYDRYRELLGAAQKSHTKIRPIPIAIAVFGIVFVTAASFFVWEYIIKAGAIEKEYDSTISMVEKLDNSEKKKKLLQRYLATNKENTYTEDIQSRIEEIDKFVEKTEYTAAVDAVKELDVDDNYDKNAKAAYMRYLNKYPEGTYSAEIEGKMFEIQELIDDVDFNKIEESESLDFDNRISGYTEYLTKHPSGKYRGDVEKMIRNLGDEYYSYLMKQLTVCDQEKKWDNCIQLCNYYLTYFNKSRQKNEIEILIPEMQEKIQVAAVLTKAREAGKNPETAKKILSEYLETHPDSFYMDEIRKELIDVERRSNEIEKWSKLTAYVKKRGGDINRKIYELKLYVEQNSSSPYRKDAESMISNLEREKEGLIQKQEGEQIQRQLAAIAREKNRINNERKKMMAKVSKVSSRFVAKANGTFTDKRTGLTWCLLDSLILINKCHDYKTASNYVKKLKTGGYSDWRLPSGSELAAIYKSSPFFPDSGADWYWSSEVYAKGYHQKVLIVTTKKEKVFKRQQLQMDECGAVRAVRP